MNPTAATVAAASPFSSSYRHSAFSEAVAALSRDMPILMHGSGDVLPDQVNPDTVQLLSELTVNYISNLVDAAVDAQVLLAAGDFPPPPPPCYPRSRKPPLPSLPPPDKKSEKDEDTNSNNIAAALAKKKRPRRPDVDYWDEPMLEPKIVSKRAKLMESKQTLTPRMGGYGSGAAYTSTLNVAGIATQEEEEDETPIHVDQWVGVAGVDLWENSRSRAAYVRMPEAIGVQCFIFPICHDGFLYGKVMQVQASRRAIAPVLVDSVLLELVRTEGALARKHAPRRKKKMDSKSAKDSGDADVEDEPDPEEDEQLQDDGAAWPGLELLLPVHAITDSITKD